MREVLDRLREAETALDAQLNDLYFKDKSPQRAFTLEYLWKAKQSLWWATLHTLNAASGGEHQETT